MSEPVAPRRDFASFAAVVAFCVGWFLAMGGYNVINPLNISWMLAGDWHGHLFGWLFTRNGPWTLPFGLAPDLMYPYGTSAAFTDAIPIASVATKVFSSSLPEAFQFFGPWLLTCVVAQGLVGWQLMRCWTKDAVVTAIAGMLCATNPIIVARYGHPPFFAQSLVLALAGLSLVPLATVHAARRAALTVLLCDFIACGVNAYLGVICSLVTGAAMLRLTVSDRWFKPREALVWLAAAPLTTLASFWLFGFLAGVKGPIDQLGAEGFGQFSADLATFWNPATNSRLFNGLPMGHRQGEGYAYLGAAVLALLALRVLLGLFDVLNGKYPDRKVALRVAPLVVVGLVAGFYALSFRITYKAQVVAELGELYAKLGSLTSVFRSSGRFTWPLHALFTLTALTVVTRWQGRPALQRAVLGAALLFQLIDLEQMKSGFHNKYAAFQPLPSPAWNEAPHGYRHFNIHPVMAQWLCPYDERLVILASWEAYRHHMTVNSGLVGRNPPELRQACTRHLPPNELDPDTIYLLYFPEYLVDFIGHGYVCGQLDGVVTCVSESKDTAFRRAVEANRIALRPPG